MMGNHLLEVAELTELLHQIEVLVSGAGCGRLRSAVVRDLHLLIHVVKCELGDGLRPLYFIVKSFVLLRQSVGR